MKLTPAARRALTAVEAGAVVRVYRSNGNILRGPKGTGANMLWWLDHRGLIADGRDATGGLEKTCTQVLTKAGREALAQT